MIYVRICYDNPGAFDLRLKHREERQAFLKKEGPVRILQAGPLCAGDGNGTYVGTLMLLDAPSREDVVAFHDDDPFTRVGVFERHFITRYDKHIG